MTLLDLWRCMTATDRVILPLAVAVLLWVVYHLGHVNGRLAQRAEEGD